MALKITDGPYSGPKGSGGKSGGGSTSMLEHAIGMLRDLVNLIINVSQGVFKISLPENQFNPDGSETFDIMRLQITNANTKESVLKYVADEMQTIRFTHYGIFNNKALGAEVRFYPTIDGSRILKWHGDPAEKFALYLSVGIDLSEQAMIPCDIKLTPGQTLEWFAENISNVQGEFGVRMRGYVVKSNKLSKSGG